MRTLLLWMLALSVMAGCAAAPPAASPPAPAAQAEAAPAASAPEREPRLTAAKTEDLARPLTEAEILAAYDRAVTACGWFLRAPLSSTEESRLAGDLVYRRVDARGIETAEDLRCYLRSLFSEELTESLMGTGGVEPMYREFDGALYVCGAGRPRDPRKGAVQAHAEQAGETDYVVNVTVELLEEDRVTAAGVECWSFPYALTDGRWVFTEFQLVD